MSLELMERTIRSERLSQPFREVDEDVEKQVFTLKQPEGSFGYIRWVFGYCVNHPYSQFFLVLCIVLNTITQGMFATDLVVNGSDAFEWKLFFEGMDELFLFFFSLESLSQLIYHGWKLFRNAWLTFDFTLVIAAWITLYLIYVEGIEIRGFRILRAFRLLQFGPMRELLFALTTVAPKLGMITLLGLLMLYIFAVLFTQLFKEYDLSHDYFNRLDLTLYTLVQMMTMDYGTPMRETMTYVSWAWIPFLLFINVMGFLMFNLGVAVVCDAVGAINDSEELERSKIKRDLRYKLFCTTKMLEEVIILQQKDIEQHLQLINRIVLGEKRYAEEIIHIEKVYKSSTTLMPNVEDESSSKENEAKEADIDNFVPQGYFSMERSTIGKVVNHHLVQQFILYCIAANCVLMGIGATDLNNNPRAVFILEYIDKGFLIIFSIESGMQLLYRGYLVFTNAWLSFDLFIVILSWALEGLAVVRGFRVIRALRITLRVGPIKDLITTLFQCINKLSAIVLLALLVFYIFAVLFTQLFKGLDLSRDYYSRLDSTAFTLLQIMTLDFATPMRETMKIYPNAWMPHILFVLVMGLVFFNLMAGVICDGIQHIKDQDKSTDQDKSIDQDDLSQLLFELRYINYQVSIQKKIGEDVREHISVLSECSQDIVRRRSSGFSSGTAESRDTSLRRPSGFSFGTEDSKN